jgi:hypothetical protein
MSLKHVYGSIVCVYMYVYPFIEFIGVFVLSTIINVLFIDYCLLRLLLRFPIYLAYKAWEKTPQKK